MTKETLIKIRRSENIINKHLFGLCAFVTVITMVMFLIEFFSKGKYTPAKISILYLGILIIYSLHKELIRWLGERKVERQGEIFVFVWVLLATFLYLIDFLTKGYFTTGANGERLSVLRDISITIIEILAVFVVTRSLKILQFLLFSKNKGL